jgi:hypothetical protein
MGTSLLLIEDNFHPARSITLLALIGETDETLKKRTHQDRAAGETSRIDHETEASVNDRQIEALVARSSVGKSLNGGTLKTDREVTYAKFTRLSDGVVIHVEAHWDFDSTAESIAEEIIRQATEALGRSDDDAEVRLREMVIVILTAREDFKSGEVGYATGHSVAHPRSGFGPEGTFVRALEDVRAGENGKFERRDEANDGPSNDGAEVPPG